MKTLKILDELEQAFDYMKDLMEDSDWDLYKFGRGGRFYPALTNLQNMAKKWDKQILRDCDEDEAVAYGHIIIFMLLDKGIEQNNMMDSFIYRLRKLQLELGGKQDVP